MLLRRLATFGAAALACALLLGAAGPALAAPSGADAPQRSGAAKQPDAPRQVDVPTEAEVQRAEADTQAAARDVAAVESELAVAQAELRESTIRAARATEDYNGARHRLEVAQRDARQATKRAEIAARAVARQQEAYGDTVATAYRMSPELSSMEAVVDAEGITTVLETANTLRSAESSMNTRWAQYRATASLAEAAEAEAEKARAEAAEAEAEAADARDRAERAQSEAAVVAEAVGQRKSALIAEYARLQGISVGLAERRQADAELGGLADAQGGSGRLNEFGNLNEGGGESAVAEDPQSVAPAPAPSKGARAAIDFAISQLGKPYVWAASGPNSYDCSGLTMRAWQRGDKQLVHWSVGQYRDATPISFADLRPGDLLFWGTSDDPASIFHVALYIGGNQMIHAPRAGRPVSLDSVFYWVTPNFYGRP